MKKIELSYNEKNTNQHNLCVLMEDLYKVIIKECGHLENIDTIEVNIKHDKNTNSWFANISSDGSNGKSGEHVIGLTAYGDIHMPDRLHSLIAKNEQEQLDELNAKYRDDPDSFSEIDKKNLDDFNEMHRNGEYGIKK